MPNLSFFPFMCAAAVCDDFVVLFVFIHFLLHIFVSFIATKLLQVAAAVFFFFIIISSSSSNSYTHSFLQVFLSFFLSCKPTCALQHSLKLLCSRSCRDQIQLLLWAWRRRRSRGVGGVGDQSLVLLWA